MYLTISSCGEKSTSFVHLKIRKLLVYILSWDTLNSHLNKSIWRGKKGFASKNFCVTYQNFVNLDCFGTTYLRPLIIARPRHPPITEPREPSRSTCLWTEPAWQKHHSENVIVHTLWKTDCRFLFQEMTNQTSIERLLVLEIESRMLRKRQRLYILVINKSNGFQTYTLTFDISGESGVCTG